MLHSSDDERLCFQQPHYNIYDALVRKQRNDVTYDMFFRHVNQPHDDFKDALIREPSNYVTNKVLTQAGSSNT